MKTYDISRLPPMITLGYDGENNWRPIAFDCTALWTEVTLPGDGLTPEHPIAYNNNMALEQGKYYAQDGVVYRCTRDTINPVYNYLKDLVGIYVEVVS